MLNTRGTVRGAGLVLAASLLASPGWSQTETPLLSFQRETPGALSLEGRVDVTWGRGPNGDVLHLRLEGNQAKAGVTLRCPEGAWDVSPWEYVAVDLRNPSPERLRVELHLQPEGPGAAQARLRDHVVLRGPARQTARLALIKKLPGEGDGPLAGMRGYPGGWFERWGLDPQRLTHLAVYVEQIGESGVELELADLRAGRWGPDWRTATDEQRFPLLDLFGQYRHKDWPGKMHAEEDLQQARQREAQELSAQPGPADWNQYGGWTAGPQLAATGFFRSEQHAGKWWLVDPEGRLFWSHGLDCVRDSTATTPITDREHYFQELPDRSSPFGQFYGSGNWAPHGYYQGKGRYRTFNFTGANLLRKYGPQWRQTFAEISHQRLRSWGLNTIANWSDPQIYRLHRTPYTATISAPSRTLEGSSGYWGKFVNVFDPSFASSLQQAMASEAANTAVDPWCIGYFVGNELSWGDDLSLALAALNSPPAQPAKQVLAADLQRKYETVQRLNQAWGTDYASWEALLSSQTSPDRNRARDDLAAFHQKTADRYFQVCREAVKRHAPNHLYLGCRFAWANESAIRAAARHCDVISFNRYADGVNDFELPGGVDRPVVIGEFHFGALDRGMLHTGLRPVANQARRAEAYGSYVRGALANRYLVGTHWFTYGDQATTGRGDGENYQIGFLDVCDSPYPEIIAACRRLGRSLYRTRLEAR